MSQQDKKKKKKKRKSIIEQELFAIINRSLKIAIDAAMDEIFKEWK